MLRFPPDEIIRDLQDELPALMMLVKRIEYRGCHVGLVSAYCKVSDVCPLCCFMDSFKCERNTDQEILFAHVWRQKWFLHHCLKELNLVACLLDPQ